MSDIDIGSAAIDRASTATLTFTLIDLANPANFWGKITSIEVWAASNMTALRVGTFYLVSGTTYKCRASATIGDVTAGSKQTFPVSIAVHDGDFIGCYFAAGTIERDTTGGSGIMYFSGESIDAGDEESYTSLAEHAISLYGTGAFLANETICCRIAFESAPYAATPAWTDVTSDLRGISIKKGRQHALDRMEAATAIITLGNEHYNYYPNNAIGDYYPDVLPGKRLNIMMVYNAVYEIFTGYITDYTPDWLTKAGMGAIMRITAVGVIGNLARLLMNDAGFSAEISGTRVDNVLDKLSSNIGRDLATGQSTMQATGTQVNVNALSHLAVVQQSELGIVFEAGDGDVQFHDRHTRLKSPYTTSQAIFSDIPGFEDLVLYLPLWHPNLNGSSFLSRDQNHHSCTVTGATWGVTGRTFDGTDDYIVLPNACFLPGTGDFTLEFWFKVPDTSAGTQVIFDSGSGVEFGNVFLAFDTNGKIIFEINDSSGAIALTSTTAWDDDAWHHCVLSATRSANAVLYVAGVSDGTLDISGDLLTISNAQLRRIGTRLDSALDLTGIIGEFRVYHRALSAGEIQHNYLTNKWRFGL